MGLEIEELGLLGSMKNPGGGAKMERSPPATEEIAQGQSRADGR